MSKIVCDICGTSYDDTTGACPVCGWAPGSSLNSDPGDMDSILPDDLQLDDLDGEDTLSAPSSRGKAVFDYDAVNTRRRQPPKPAPKKEEEEDDEEDDEEPGSNKFLVIILVILILALLAVSVYIGYTKILKPNQKGDDNNKPQDSISATESTGSVVDTAGVVDAANPTADTGSSEPTEPGQADPITSAIPCTGLSLDGSVDELTFAGQYRRISVRVTPENTTDQVTYTSGDPNVVTVDDKGHVTAVGEGQTVIVISCGSKRIDTPIVVKYAESATEASTNPSDAPAVGTDTAVATPAPGNILALKRNGKTASDVTIGKIGVYITLELDNNIPVESAKWSTSDSSVATVYNGNVTAVGKGNCVIRAEYNGQTAECVIRVK